MSKRKDILRAWKAPDVAKMAWNLGYLAGLRAAAKVKHSDCEFAGAGPPPVNKNRYVDGWDCGHYCHVMAVREKANRFARRRNL